MSKMKWAVSDSFGGTTRRRGAKLGLLVAVLAVIPGLVAGTQFVSGSGTASLNGTGTPTSIAACGFDTGNANTKDTASYLTVTGTTAIAGTSSPTLYSTLTVTVNAFEVGSSGYEYLDGEVDIACENVALTGTISVYGTTTTAPTNLVWMYADVEASTANPPFLSGTAPSITYCGPGADTPTAFPVAVGGACATTPVQATCDALSEPVFLPNDKDASGNNFVYNVMSGGTALGTCGTNVGTTAPGTTIVSSLTVSSTVIYYGIVSFAIGGAASTLTTSSFSLTTTAT
ncbi:MAG: hypothetical protein KGJ23_12350 [Euryarchaeota archaeon]|nr:hypothetical protein [Euryarchaeota archaeon]MDE1881943.1 hypothetical protein [Euryarchaeota archaeon]MDE2045512.1 hypothetical protein [Thermoplasmata archaeon]